MLIYPVLASTGDKSIVSSTPKESTTATQSETENKIKVVWQRVQMNKLKN